MDGVVDCIDGGDEEKIWPSCGFRKSFRYVISNDTCENVFICPRGEPGYVVLDKLCDGLGTCGNENEVCSRARGTPRISTTVLTSDKGLSKHLSHCIRGLSKTANFMDNCYVFPSFTYPDHNFFGAHETKVVLPKDLQSCDYMYGEQYVYTSCTNKCTNSECPLRNVPRYGVCHGQYPHRIGTIANNEFLVFVTRSFGNIFTNRYFVCDNKFICIDYSKVCNLVDDCGDASDEQNCTNHFKCNSTDHYITLDRKCDGSFDCLDYSDECNDQCSNYILKTTALKGLSWVIGFSAVLANSIIILKNVVTIKKCRTTVALLNKTLIMLISLGDFMVGSYLFVISAYDGLVFGVKYCTQHTSWITSTNCSVIGVLSTVGSQVSLFAMGVLSVSRLYGIYNSMRVPGEISAIKLLKVSASLLMMIGLSISIAIIPIVKKFEDFFVNGVKYAEELKIFIGTPSKEKVLAVLAAYYGRMRGGTLSWSKINGMVSDIYSHDYDYQDHSKAISMVNFYGNDGVCLFKYFVKDKDPQRVFVWTILAINFTCFVLITISYIMISLISQRSSKSLTKSAGNQQISRRNRKMNRKISIIITTDFLCWVPFIAICILHSAEVVDATPWYSLFSIIILPINSVINPLIYEDYVANVMTTPVRRVSGLITGTSVYQSYRNRARPGGPTSEEPIEMNCVVAPGGGMKADARVIGSGREDKITERAN
jgi:hypothetical protein